MIENEVKFLVFAHHYDVKYIIFYFNKIKDVECSRGACNEIKCKIYKNRW